MQIYTNHNGKHLYMPVPRDWTFEDVQFFLTGKTKSNEPPFNPKPHLSIVNRTPPSTEPGPIKAVHVESEPEPEPELYDGKCPRHPNYTGQRLGKNARECKGCVAVYKAAHKDDVKDSNASS